MHTQGAKPVVVVVRRRSRIARAGLALSPGDDVNGPTAPSTGGGGSAAGAVATAALSTSTADGLPVRLVAS